MRNTSKVSNIAPAITSERLSEFVGYQIRRASMQVQADLSETLVPFDLRMITFSALSVVSENAGMRQYQLADALAIERPNLVVIIDELETRGLILRDQVPSDRRAYALRITKQGSALLKRAEKAVKAHEDKLFGHLTDSDRELLIAAFASVESKRAEQK